MERWRFPRARRLLLATLLALAVPLSAVAQEAIEATPQERIRASNEAIVAAFGDSQTLSPESEPIVFEIMNSVTDFATLSGTAIDGFCGELTPETCVRFKETFSELLRTSAVRKLGRYRADRFDYLGEEIDGLQARVRTMAHYEGDGISLDYYLARTEAGWRIVNYVIDGIDTVRDYRKQLARMLRDRSADEVIDQLQRRIEQLRESS